MGDTTYKYEFPFKGALAKFRAGMPERMKMLMFPSGTPVLVNKPRDTRTLRGRYPHLDLRGARSKYGFGNGS